jgi:tetratricopeptide (TPR) repeat protein
VFSALGQVQDAIAACRESRDIFAAAGDQKNEARSLRAWADAITETDAPQSILLYRQAQTIFRKVGSESGVAEVLNNLGRVYDAQGDPATAEKMQRQALAISRLLDDKRREATMTANIANERSEQGDLPGALQLYEESAHLDPEDAGHSTNAEYNIADIHRMQGDLAGARRGFEESLATWQKSGDQDASGYALSSLGTLLLQQGDFSGARKRYGQALAIRTQAGETLSAAEIQLGLAEVALEEGQAPVEQEAAIRQAIEVFQKQKSRDDEIHAWCDLARALLAEGKTSPATEAVQSARFLAARSQNPEVRWQAAMTAASIRKDYSARATSKELAAIVTQSRTMGYAGIELEARLALAEIEKQAGHTDTSRAQLTAIAAEAEAKGFHLIARKASLARG